MNILITGAGGQLGNEIKEEVIAYPYYNYFFETSSSLDITKFEALREYIQCNQIDLVINCAAYTAVDKAESEKDLAYEVNVLGVKNLLEALSLVEGKLVHISTDYVFDGKTSSPYAERNKVNPLGVYGKTKREAEVCIESSSVASVIIRTSWLYSSHRFNFVKTMLRLAEEKNEIGVVSDQIGSPTYAKDLAKVCLAIISKWNLRKSNIYHYANQGVASWYDFAYAVIELNGMECEVNPIETKDFKNVAERPPYSILNTNKIKRDFGITIPYWRDSLRECLELIKKR